MLPVFSHTNVHATSDENGKFIRQEATMTRGAKSKLCCLAPYTQTRPGNFLKTQTRGSVWVFLSAEAFTWRTISWTVRDRERERQRRLLYEASCSVCSTFSGWYSSAVTQAIIFKRSIYCEQTRLRSYGELLHLKQVLLLNWYNNKLGEKQQTYCEELFVLYSTAVLTPDVCCSSPFLVPSHIGLV